MSEVRQWWKHLSQWAQGFILIMVSVLFFGWSVFGSSQVAGQTDAIVREVHAAVDKNFAAIADNQATLLASNRYIVCVLKTLPEHRKPKVIHRCLRQSGLAALQEG